MTVYQHIRSLSVLVCRIYTKFKLAILIFMWFALVLAYTVVTVVSGNVAGGCNSTHIPCSGSKGRVWSMTVPSRRRHGMNKSLQVWEYRTVSCL
jgi:hypothetical protein